tara:strand:+ start:2200 stop:2427 length:228 start_codon:yes stop_codon:yes gene_type:complete
MITSIEYKNDFYINHIDYFMDFFYEIKENLKLLGFLNNSKVEKFFEIILDNLNFKDNSSIEEINESDLSDEEYLN